MSWSASSGNFVWENRNFWGSESRGASGTGMPRLWKPLLIPTKPIIRVNEGDWPPQPLVLDFLKMVAFLGAPPLTPALSPRRGERELSKRWLFFPSSPMGERIRVRGN
jgi:hypothetical protein